MARGWRFAAAACLLLVLGCGSSTSETTSNTPPNSETVNTLDLSTEEGLYVAAQVAQHERRSHDAIELYRRILAEYPESAQSYKAEFLVGFIFAEELGQPDSARASFERVIRDYPECEFVDDAQTMLSFLDGDTLVFEDAPTP